MEGRREHHLYSCSPPPDARRRRRVGLVFSSGDDMKTKRTTQHESRLTYEELAALVHKGDGAPTSISVTDEPVDYDRDFNSVLIRYDTIEDLRVCENCDQMSQYSVGPHDVMLCADCKG